MNILPFPEITMFVWSLHAFVERFILKIRIWSLLTAGMGDGSSLNGEKRPMMILRLANLHFLTFPVNNGTRLSLPGDSRFESVNEGDE